MISAAQVVAGAKGLAKVALRWGIADKETIEHRRDTCRRCEFSTKHPTQKTATGLPLVYRCLACGCFIAAKTQLAEVACPKGFYPAVVPAPLTSAP